MKIKQTYIAKDGTEFDDLFECERYESVLDLVPGSVGEFLETIKQYNEELYVNALIIVKHKGNNVNIAFQTVCLEAFDDYVSVDEFEPLQKLLSSRLIDIKKSLESKFDKDDPCQYVVFMMKGLYPISCATVANYNPEIWK